jgi:hypothetical protein
VLAEDTVDRLQELPAVFNPFDDIYRLIFLHMMRTVGCHDIATDRKLLDQMLDYYHGFSDCTTLSVIVFPWLPSPSLIKRFYCGARLYLILKGIVSERQKLATQGIRKFDDPLQELVDRHCGSSHIIGVSRYFYRDKLPATNEASRSC